MGNGNVKRYIGGKKPNKYFNEDIWPLQSVMFEKLGIDQSKGFEMFQAFSRIDTDQSGKVSVKECMAFFGGKITRYTERLFDVLDVGERDGLEFPEFVFALWNFCTMYTVLIARHLFEIFDPDFQGSLEKPDIEAIYRMIYDSDFHEAKLTDVFPYDANGRISREEFVAYIKNNRNFIKPASTFQNRVRKALGGLIMWETLTSYRKKYFAQIDETSSSLDDAVAKILAYQKAESKKVEIDWEERDRLEREEVLRKAEELKQELLKREEEMQIEKRKRESQLDDENVKLAWMSFEAIKSAFAEEHFTKNTIWERQERRGEVFQALDNAVKVSEDYWAMKYEKEFKLVCPDGGMPLAEQEARLKDFLETKEGQQEQGRNECEKLLTLVFDRLLKRVSYEDPMVKSVEAVLTNLKSDLSTLEQAQRFASALAKWGETKKAKEGLHERMREFVMNKAISTVTDRQKAEREEREKTYKRKDFDICTNFGSRHTRWEEVYDAKLRKKIIINVDTLQILEDKFCICESCDAMIDPADFKCYSCTNMRSVKNQKFYRALGT